MPFTFFAHQIFVAPLKWVRPRWFDGTALCIGSMAPDLAYALSGTPLAFASHTLLAQIAWSVPITVALTLVWRHRIADRLGCHLSGQVASEVRALAVARRPIAMTAASAFIGGLSHIFVDGFTHPGGWAIDQLGGSRALAHHLQYLGHTVGTTAGVLFLVLLVRAGKLSAWSESMTPQKAARRSPLFWPIVLVGCLAATIVGPASYGIATGIIRASWMVFLALVVASLSRS